MKRLIFILLMILAPVKVYASALSTAAASCAVGAWCEVTGTNLNASMLSYGSGYVLQYATRMNWDATTKRIDFIGQVHGAESPHPPGTITPGATTGNGVTFTLSSANAITSANIGWNIFNAVAPGAATITSITDSTHVVADIITPFPDTSTIAANNWRIDPNGKQIKYDDATNTWSTINSADFWGRKLGPVHDFNDTTTNPATGTIYHFNPGDQRIYAFSESGATWSGPIATPFGGSTSVIAAALCVFPDRNGMLFLAGDAGLYFYSFATNSWTTLGTTGPSGNTYPTGAYGNFCQYNPIRHEVLFGGGVGYSNENRIYAMNSAGTITAKANAPTLIQISSPVTALVTVDPVTGTYLVMTSDSSNIGTFRSYNSTNDTWGTLAVGSKPPWWGNSEDGDVFGTVATPIPDYGVIAFLDWESGSFFGGVPKLWLFKYSAADFAARCSAPGVVRCFSFDNSANLGTAGGGGDFGYFNNLGTCGTLPSTASCPVLDTSTAVEGHGSIKMTTHSGGNSSTAGQWYGNFSTNLSQKFGAGQTFYIQWRQRFDSNMMQAFHGDETYPAGTLTPSATSGTNVTVTSSVPVFGTTANAFDWITNNTTSFLARIRSVTDSTHAQVYIYTPFANTSAIASGQWKTNPQFKQWKQVIISAGDNTGCTPSNSTVPPCSGAGGANELVPFTRYNWHYPMMYNSQTGSTHVTAFAPFQESFNGTDFKNENARTSPYCLYSQEFTFPETVLPPSGNCFSYVANEWMTFKVGVTLGSLVGDEFVGSRVRLWAAREGQPSELLIDWNNQYIAAGTDTNFQKYGKIWLLPHMTNKSTTQVHPDANTWYANVIISTQDIADPVGAIDTTPPTVAITSPINNSTVISSPITASGTAADNTGVTSVTWTCPTCTPTGGTATGTTSWTVSGIGLSSGLNTITAISHDAAGNVSTGAQVNVTYTPPLTWYADTVNGNDSNSCTQAQTSTTAKKTITAALACVGAAETDNGAGKTVIVQNGTYAEQLWRLIPNGTAGNPFTLKAANARQAIIKPTSVPGGPSIVELDNTVHYVVIRDLVIDGSGLSVTSQGLGFSSATESNLHDITIYNNEIRFIHNSGISLYGSNFTIGSNFVHNGGQDGFDHACYCHPSNSTIHANIFSNWTGYGWHPNTGGLDTINNNEISGNTFTGLGFVGGQWGVLLAGRNQRFFNNLVYGNNAAIIVGHFANTADTNFIYENTIYNNPNSTYQAIVLQGQSNTSVTNNIIQSSGTPIDPNFEAAATFTTNLCDVTQAGCTNANPQFTNAAGGNFTLLGSSPAINIGTTLGAPYNVDFAGIGRPQGTGYDIGAYERIVTPPPTVMITNPTANPTYTCMGSAGCNGVINLSGTSSLTP